MIVDRPFNGPSLVLLIVKKATSHIFFAKGSIMDKRTKLMIVGLIVLAVAAIVVNTLLFTGNLFKTSGRDAGLMSPR